MGRLTETPLAPARPAAFRTKYRLLGEAGSEQPTRPASVAAGTAAARAATRSAAPPGARYSESRSVPLSGRKKNSTPAAKGRSRCRAEADTEEAHHEPLTSICRPYPMPTAGLLPVEARHTLLSASTQEHWTETRSGDQLRHTAQHRGPVRTPPNLAGGYRAQALTVTSSGPNTVSFSTVAVTVYKNGSRLPTATVAHSTDGGGAQACGAASDCRRAVAPCEGADHIHDDLTAGARRSIASDLRS